MKTQTWGTIQQHMDNRFTSAEPYFPCMFYPAGVPDCQFAGLLEWEAKR